VDAAQALADLTEISSQIEAAVVAEADGKVLASTFADDARAERLATASRTLLAAAEQVRGESGAPLAQLEAATADGSVLVVRDGERLIAAARDYLDSWQPNPGEPITPWAGLRPATPDGLPLIGALPGLENVYAETE